MTLTPPVLDPPSDLQASLALADFVAQVRSFYGSRLVDVHLFGSRARGDHRPESDADIAIVVNEYRSSFLEDKIALCDITWYLFVDFGLLIQPWPFLEADWERPGPEYRFYDLIVAARAHAQPLVQLR